LGTLSKAKTLGGLGSIFVLLTGVPIVGFLFGTVGFVLILVAMRYVSQSVLDRAIFYNTLVSVVLAIVGLVLSTFVIMRSILRFVGLRPLAGYQPFGPSFDPPIVQSGDWAGLFVSLLPVLFVVWIVLLPSAIYARKAYDSIAARMRHKTFGTASLVYLTASATTIAFIGFVLLFVAQILFVRAFFSMEDELPTPQIPQVKPAQPSPSAT
jgi:uncharacterized membrane protein